MGNKFSFSILEGFCRELFAAAGVPEADARIVAFIVADTSLEGIDTHGISRVPIYIKCLLNGRINPRPTITKTINGSVAGVDGDNGLGQLVAYHSMNTAIDLARTYGIGYVTVKNSNHFGAASTYCKMAAEQQMIGQVYTNSPSAIPPWGGIAPYFGTNPIAYGFPTSAHPIIVDLSSSVVARGNIILAAQENRPIPEGWAIDKYGNPTTNAQEALEGAVLPFGGVKGYALALAVEMMAGIISGSAYGGHVRWMYEEGNEPANIGHSFLAIDIAKLMPFEDYIQRVNNMIREIRETPKAEYSQEIRIPGDRRQANREKRRKEGIPVSDGLLQELNALAARLGIPILA